MDRGGDDVYLLTSIALTQFEFWEADGCGTDTIIATSSYTLPTPEINFCYIENLVLDTTRNLNGTGNRLDNYITGNDGSNILSGLGGNDTLDGHGYVNRDTLIGGTGNDTYIYRGNDIIKEYDNEGIDNVLQYASSYALSKYVENLTLLGDANAHGLNGAGNSLDNYITGNEWDNMLFGFAGNDTLDGGTGRDMLFGGSGDDIYIVDTTTETITELANGGEDTVWSSVSYTLGNNIENLTLTGNVGLSGTGNSLNNVLMGTIGNDTLYGLNGDDVLYGEGGTDNLIGGAGNDTYTVDTITNTITELANGGTDTVRSFVSYTLGNNIEKLTLGGNVGLYGTGSSDNNTITGTDGNDTIDGAGGTDILVGGAGNDTYIVDTTTDTITELANGGTDTVRSSVSYALSGNIENLTLTGAIGLYGTGSSANNTITGTTGNDTLDGAGGTDILVGGTGNDTYIVDTTTDTITELANGGEDTVRSSVSYVLNNNSEIEDLVLTGESAINGTGNALNNIIMGNGAANTLYGGTGNDILWGDAGDDMLYGQSGADILYGYAGNDSLIGGADAANDMQGGDGDDWYEVDNISDIIREDINEGTDKVSSHVSTYTLASNVEDLELYNNSSVLAGYGNEIGNVITGNNYNNSLYGLAGNDTLDGAGGTDTLTGGDGNDTYIVDTTTDTLRELSDGGTDTVLSSVSYTLSSAIENLTLTGTASSGAGNAFANIVTGNACDNFLYGNLGMDTLVASAGNDTLKGGIDNDTYLVSDGFAGFTVIEDGNDAADVLRFNGMMKAGNNDILNLTRNGNDMLLTVYGQSGIVTFKDWYAADANRVEIARFDDGEINLVNQGALLNSDLNAVISQISGFGAFACSGGGAIQDIDATRQNTGLMAMVNPNWH